MTTDADNFWDSFAERLRRLKGLSPLTCAEAEAAMRAAKKRPASECEIDSIVDAVVRGEIPVADPQPEADSSPVFNYEEIDEDAVVLHRNQGEGASGSDSAEEELIEELLEEDEPQVDGDRVEG